MNSLSDTYILIPHCLQLGKCCTGTCACRYYHVHVTVLVDVIMRHVIALHGLVDMIHDTCKLHVHVMGVLQHGPGMERAWVSCNNYV